MRLHDISELFSSQEQNVFSNNPIIVSVIKETGCISEREHIPPTHWRFQLLLNNASGTIISDISFPSVRMCNFVSVGIILTV